MVQVAEGYYEFTLFLSMYESHHLSYDMTRVRTSATAFCVLLARESHVMCIRATRLYYLARQGVFPAVMLERWTNVSRAFNMCG